MSDPAGASGKLTLTPLAAVALCWTLGVAAGLTFAPAAGSLALGLILCVPMLVMLARRRRRAAGLWGLLVTAVLAAAWASVRTQYVPPDHVLQFLTPDPQIVEVAGVVDDQVYLGPPQRGAFADFAYEPPITLFVLRLQVMTIDGRSRPASGRLLVKIAEADHRVRPGMRLGARGWMSAFAGPLNPGDRDVRKTFAERDIDGRLMLESRENWTLLSPPGALGAFAALRATISQAAVRSLRLGMPDVPRRNGFLDLILLGNRSADIAELNAAFQKVGLAHILSISGAHLAILMGLVAMAVRGLVRSPPRAALIVLGVLVLYLLAVPMQTPIVRSGIMAGVFCLGYLTGRRPRGLDLLALSLIIVLLWRPADLANAGFQLSFGVVAGLLLFTRPVSAWIYAQPIHLDQGDRTLAAVLRRGADYLAANLVAFAVALPLVAYHFEIVSPMTVLLSIVALPVITSLLGVGYLKIAVGAVLPSGGIVLAGPLAWVADAMTGLVDHAATWPGSAVVLRQAPPAVWVAATLGLTIALLCGRFARRRAALGAAAGLCTAWLITSQVSPSRWLAAPAQHRAVTLTMFAVGDGSCFLVRVPDVSGRDRTLLFDCGSQGYMDIGIATVAPGLRRLGVDRIDLLMVSHADLDHYCGVLDVADAVPIARAMAPPQLLAEAGSAPDGAAAHLIAGLREREITVEPAGRGWCAAFGAAQLDLLWPPPGLSGVRANDTSLVLSVRVGKSRLLLCGDIQQRAITELLTLRSRGEVDVAADVCDLPHHGSFVDASPDWIAAVAPTLVLQSSGPRRLFDDPWGPVLQHLGVPRMITAEHGMVEVRLRPDGRIESEGFKTPR